MPCFGSYWGRFRIILAYHFPLALRPPSARPKRLIGQHSTPPAHYYSLPVYAVQGW
jgi:hypothetical protein